MRSAKLAQAVSGDTSARAVGENVRRARKLAGLTQEELAERAGVSGPYVSMLENGESEASVAVYRAIANSCGISLSEIFKMIDRAIPAPLARLLESYEADGDRLTDHEIDYLRGVTIPGRRMTTAAYSHALAMYRAARPVEDADEQDA